MLFKSLLQNKSGDRPSLNSTNEKLLWYPQAVIPKEKMVTQGKYKNGYPRGAVVHYTAGGNDPLNTLAWGREMKYCYFLIDRDGKVYQSFPLDQWGYHAGVSRWLGVESLSRHYVGIEVMSAGTLTKVPDNVDDKEAKYAAWFHFNNATKKLKKDAKLFSYDEVRFSNRSCNINPGIYHKFTEEQEESLIELLIWLKLNNPNVFQLAEVVGHDEIAPERKQDPGGALSMTMYSLRQKLSSLYYGDKLG